LFREKSLELFLTYLETYTVFCFLHIQHTLLNDQSILYRHTLIMKYNNTKMEIHGKKLSSKSKV